MLEVGSVVRSIAGHDKHRYYMIVGSEGLNAFIADGKMRKLENPKRKNVKHLRKTNKVIELDEITSNKALNRILEPMNQALLQGDTTQEEGF